MRGEGDPAASMGMCTRAEHRPGEVERGALNSRESQHKPFSQVLTAALGCSLPSLLCLALFTWVYSPAQQEFRWEDDVPEIHSRNTGMFSLGDLYYGLSALTLQGTSMG